MVLELRPAHDPDATCGFVGVVVSTEDLSASVWRWHRDGDRWAADKVITIPAEPADRRPLPPALKPFGAVPPLVTDIDLSVDDRMLYVSCWGTGELKQYDVTRPGAPARGRVGAPRRDRRRGSRTRRRRSERAGRRPADGRGQPRRPPGLRHQLALRRRGTTSSTRDGVGAWMAKIDADPAGGLTVDARFFPHGDDFRGLRAHQVRLQGGDASSDSYCYR